jgi:hypothetical protein
LYSPQHFLPSKSMDQRQVCPYGASCSSRDPDHFALLRYIACGLVVLCAHLITPNTHSHTIPETALLHRFQKAFFNHPTWCQCDVSSLCCAIKSTFSLSTQDIVAVLCGNLLVNKALSVSMDRVDIAFTNTAYLKQRS